MDASFAWGSRPGLLQCWPHSLLHLPHSLLLEEGSSSHEKHLSAWWENRTWVLGTENCTASCREEPKGAFHIAQWVGLPPTKAFNYLSKWFPMLPPSPKSSSVTSRVHMLGFWLPLRALGISHMLAIIPAAFEAEILILHKNMVQWSEISIWNWPGPDNALSHFSACLSLPTPSPCCFFLPFFSSSVQFPTRQDLGVPLPQRDLDQRWCRHKLCGFSLHRDPPFPPFHSLKDRSNKKAGLVQHLSEPPKGHNTLQAGTKGLETRCRCGFASKEGMGGELIEGKTCPSPIRTIWSTTMSHGMQCSHKAVQLYRGLPPRRHAASHLVAQHDHRVTGTVGKGGRKEEGGPLVRALSGPRRDDLDGNWLSWLTCL